MADHLDVWLYGVKVARLSEPRTYQYRLDFTEEALDSYGDGSRMLTLAFPLSVTPVRDRAGPAERPVSAFLEGLLPEGPLRNHLASTLGVLSIDKMALLSQVGAECAGAVQFLPPERTPGEGSVRRLTAGEVDRLVSDLPTYHLPRGTALQASLAGVQDKVLLTRLEDGSWGWPGDGAASTHIIKPEPRLDVALPHLIATEHWALEVARAAGLPAARSELAQFEDRSALVVARYDRTPSGERMHQEDFCQALGLDPAAKYESTPEYEARGSRLSRLVKVAADRADDPTAFRRRLVEAVTFNVVSGNGDAHSKNYSLLIGERGDVDLAPLYDTAPVMYLEQRFKNTGHVIAGRTNIDRVDSDDLVEEATSWGTPRRLAERAVSEVMERTYAAAHDVMLPEGTEQIIERLDAMWARRSWAKPV